MACRGCDDQCYCTVVAGNGSVIVTGSGTSVSPYTVSARASAASGNALAVRPDGLYVPTSSVPGAWTAYTPTWALAGSSVASPTVGNGTLSGRYARIGDIVFLNITLSFGTTTTVGSGDTWSFTAPVAARSASTNRDVGSADLLNPATPARWTGSVLFTNTTTLVIPMHATSGFWGPLVPSTTWSPSTQLRLSITYEAAS